MDHKLSDFDDEYFSKRESSASKRKQMHLLDYRWVRNNLPSFKGNQLSIIDIGCDDGGFLTLFEDSVFTKYGIEPNSSRAEIALKNGITIIKNLEEIQALDIAIIRGTLHHIPNASELIHSISQILSNSNGSFFILANPNAESWLYRRFKRLPMLEDSSEFTSIYKVFGAKTLKREMENLGYRVKISFPYLKSPYALPFVDLPSVLIGIIIKKYVARPFPRNIFNMLASKG